MKSVPHQSYFSLDHIVFYRAWMEDTLELKDIARRYLGEHEVEEADKTRMRIEKSPYRGLQALGTLFVCTSDPLEHGSLAQTLSG